VERARRSERRAPGRRRPAGGSRARLFLALDLPDADRERLVAWREAALGPRPELRLVPAASLHVTLVFLGHRDEAEVEKIARTGLGAVDGMAAPLLQPSGMRALPPRRPRLVALDLADEEGRAGAAARAAAEALAAAGLHEPERRPFWAHLTLARVCAGARLGFIDVEPPPDQAFSVPRATLYRSHLSPRGARYEPLRSLRLG
jgi:2'-5' RNA ligase